MKILFNLIKKDLILIFQYIPVFLIVAIVLPIFLYQQVGHVSSVFIPYFISTLFLVYFMFTSILTIEEKYKGMTFLSTTPYTRKNTVIGRYLFLIVSFFICGCLHTLVALLFPSILKKLDIRTVAVSTLIFSIIFGTYLPLLFKFGYEKIKIMTLIPIIATPYVIPAITVYLQKKGIEIDFYKEIPSQLLNMSMFAMAIVIVWISLRLSIGIYARKDL